MASASGVQKQLDKIQQTIQSGAYYEAQQMFKTVYHRYKARQQIDASYHILCEGAVQQLGAGQIACAVELGLLLVEAYTTAAVPVTAESLGRVQRIIQAYPTPTDAQKEDSTILEESVRFVAASIKWAKKHGHGHEADELHDLLGLYLWRAYGPAALGLALMHLIQGADADALAGVLVEMAPKCKPEERDLLVARAVFQVLAAGRVGRGKQLQHAQDLVHACKRRQLWPDTPLMHLANFVVQALVEDAPSVFGLLRTKYNKSLERDPVLDAYLAKTEQVYFSRGVPQDGPGIAGMLGNFMRMLGDDGDLD